MNYIWLKIKENITTVYWLAISLSVFIFLIFVYPDRADRGLASQEAIDHFKKLSRNNPEEGSRVYQVLENGGTQFLDVSLFKTLAITVNEIDRFRSIVTLLNHLRGFWGNAESVFAVGDEGTILKRTVDGVWKIEENPESGRNLLYSIWGNAESVFAVGDKGTILKRTVDGVWKGEENPAKRFSFLGRRTTEKLYSIWGNAESVFAVGGNGTILKRTVDGVWEREENPESGRNSLYSIWGNAESVFAVGGNGTILKRTVDGVWEREENPESGRNSLYSIWGNAESVFAVGGNGTILRRTVDGIWMIATGILLWDKALPYITIDVEIRVDIIAIFLVGFITLAVLGYTLLPRNGQQVIPDKKLPKDTAAAETKAAGFAEDGLAWQTFAEAKSTMNSMLRRSTVLLAFGISMALLGVFLFYYFVDPLTQLSGIDERHWMRFGRNLGILIFIEALAFFFLRQYRATLNDYRYYYSIYLDRSDYLTAVQLVNTGKNGRLTNEQKKLLLEILAKNPQLSSTERIDINDPAIAKMLVDLLQKSVLKQKS